MTHVLERHRYHADIIDQDTGCTMARVYLTSRNPHPVCDLQGRLLFSVLQLDDAVAEFERSYGDHQPPWQPVYTSHSQEGLPRFYLKRTPLGELRVQQRHAGDWIPMRDGMPLLEGNRVATFPSCGTAQAAADTHARSAPRRDKIAEYWITWGRLA
jgi:hypothetical protein